MALTGQQQQQQQQMSKNSTISCRDDISLPVIPMPDEDPMAWEEALAVMYRSQPEIQVGGDNAERLLLLADKFDCPCILGHVRSFFCRKVDGQPPVATPGQVPTTELMRGLTADNVISWLVTFSKCGQDDLASLCIDYMRANVTPLPDGFYSSGVQAKHLVELCNVFQAETRTLRNMLSNEKQFGATTNKLLDIATRRAADLNAKLVSLQSELDSSRKKIAQARENSIEYKTKLAAAQRESSAVQEYKGYGCDKCSTEWYRKPNSMLPTEHCVSCGATKSRFMRALYLYSPY